MKPFGWCRSTNLKHGVQRTNVVEPRLHRAKHRACSTDCGTVITVCCNRAFSGRVSAARGRGDPVWGEPVSSTYCRHLRFAPGGSPIALGPCGTSSRVGVDKMRVLATSSSAPCFWRSRRRSAAPRRTDPCEPGGHSKAPSAADDVVIRGWALNMSNTATGANQTIRININGWSSLSQRQHLITTFLEKKQDKLLRELENSLNMGGSTSPATWAWTRTASCA
jgi:hypothetical protein